MVGFWMVWFRIINRKRFNWIRVFVCMSHTYGPLSYHNPTFKSKTLFLNRQFFFLWKNMRILISIWQWSEPAQIINFFRDEFDNCERMWICCFSDDFSFQNAKLKTPDFSWWIFNESAFGWQSGRRAIQKARRFFMEKPGRAGWSYIFTFS